MKDRRPKTSDQRPPMSGGGSLPSVFGPRSLVLGRLRPREHSLPASGSPTNSPISSPLVTRHPSLPRDARGGFALLITITLLAFLVVLLVGLAAYTRIETAVASNTQRQTQARQNALLGLDVALGQLQKYAGQDPPASATTA